MLVLRAFQTDNTPLPCERWQFSKLPVTIGRNPQNDFAPQHPAISNFHARLEQSGDQFYIRDLASSNGVFVQRAAGGELQRVPPHTNVELASSGYRFYLSSSVWVQLEMAPTDSAREQRETPRPRVSTPSAPMGPAGHPNPDEGPQSQYLDVQLDYLALQGLRELARSLLPTRELETTGDVARLIKKLHDTVDLFCRSFIPLRQGYEQFVSSLDLEAKRSMRMSGSAAMLEVATKPEAVALALLDPREHSSEAARAAETILSDLARHQIAVLDGVMQGVRALLEELSPEKIEEAAEQRSGADLFGSKHRARWAEFRERYERLSDEREAFGVIFGQEFAEAYRRYWNRDGNR